MILSIWAQNRQQTNEQINSFFMNYIIYDIIVGNRKRFQSLDSRPNLVLDFSRTIARDQIPDPLKCWLFVLFARMCWSRNKGRRFRDSVAPLVPMSTMSRGRSPTKSILNSKKSTTSWVGPRRGKTSIRRKRLVQNVLTIAPFLCKSKLDPPTNQWLRSTSAAKWNAVIGGKSDDREFVTL